MMKDVDFLNEEGLEVNIKIASHMFKLSVKENGVLNSQIWQIRKVSPMSPGYFVSDLLS